MYRAEYPYERYLFGYGVRTKDIRPDDLPVIRDLYAAEVTYSDHCIGRLLDQVEKLELLDDTVIVFSTDHGTHLGEEGCVQKTPALLNRCVTHIPLIIRHPDRRFAGKRVEGLVSAVDYLPTFLSLLGIGGYRNVDGQDAWKLATGEAASLHEEVYSVFADFGGSAVRLVLLPECPRQEPGQRAVPVQLQGGSAPREERLAGFPGRSKTIAGQTGKAPGDRDTAVAGVSRTSRDGERATEPRGR